jgi:negative regulator of sigma E activity
MNRDDDQKLWDLLGRAAEPKASPFFARNVLRRIRQPAAWTTLREWFALRRLIPTTGVAVAVLAVLLLRTQMPPPSSSEPEQPAIVSAQDYEVITDLDDLVASDDNVTWEDSILL